MAMANMNLIGVFVTKLWPVQALACGGGDGGDGGGGGGATKTIISPKFSNFGDIIMLLPARKAQPQNPVHHSTPWCEERGKGSTDIVLGPIEAPPGHGSAAWIPNTTKLHSLFAV